MDVRLDSDRQYNLFVSNVVRSPNVSRWLPSTRRIHFSDDAGDMPIASTLFMHQLGGRFPNLEQLELDGLKWDTRESSISPRMFIFLGAFASVRTLILDDVRFPSSGTMRCTITALPSLTDLEMWGVTWPISRSIRPLRNASKSEFLKRLRRFKFLGPDSRLVEEMVEWLSITAFGTSLVNLQMNETMLIKGSELWRHTGPSVTQLAINFLDKGEALSTIGTSHQDAILH